MSPEANPFEPHAELSALRAEAAESRDLLNYATDLVHATDADLRLTYVNRTWCNALGFAAEEAIGRSLLDVVHPDFLPQSAQVLAPRLDDPAPAPWVIAAVLAPKSGGRLVVEGTVSARFEGGRFAGTRAYLRDVSERRAAEDALLRSRDELCAANAALEMTVEPPPESPAPLSRRGRR